MELLVSLSATVDTDIQLMIYLGIVGKPFSDGGYRYSLVQSEVIAEGSVDNTLSGKMYKRSVPEVKLTYEALYRMLLEKFIEDMVVKDAAGFSQTEEDMHVFSRHL